MPHRFQPTGAILCLLTGLLTAAESPTVTTISPESGPVTGGTLVTFYGTNLTDFTQVTFGGAEATILSATTGTTMIVSTPAHDAGLVDVQLVRPGQYKTLLKRFTYHATEPAITSLSPTAGSTAGGTEVTISGVNLSGVTSVMFGDTAGTTITDTTASSVTVTAPAHVAGPVDISLTATNGTATKTDGFTYQVIPAGAPTITSISPRKGHFLIGGVLTVTGTNLAGVSSVEFERTTDPIYTLAGTNITANTATSFEVRSPTFIGEGVVNVVVTATAGTATSVGGVTFINPPHTTVSALVPDAGPATGGTVVMVLGRNLSGVTDVTFDGVSGTITGTTSTTVAVVTPPHAVGAVELTVSGQVPETEIGFTIHPYQQYTYVVPPANDERVIRMVNPLGFIWESLPAQSLLTQDNGSTVLSGLDANEDHQVSPVPAVVD